MQIKNSKGKNKKIYELDRALFNFYFFIVNFFDRREAEEVRFELTVKINPTTVFKTVALNHSATLPDVATI